MAIVPSSQFTVPSQSYLRRKLTGLRTTYRVRRVTAAGLVVIYDAVDVAAIPSNAQVILAYIDGGYRTYNAVKARFPNARVLTITTNGLNRADICDVESQDATPAIAAQGVRKGLYVNVYSDRSTKPALDSALAGLFWNWYCAAPGTTAALQPRSVATQFAWPGYGSPGNYDISVADPNWLNPAPIPVPPTPTPTPKPTPQKEFSMFYTDPVTGTPVGTDAVGNIYARDGGIPHVVTLPQHPEWGAGNWLNPVVGLVSEKDGPDKGGTWGYTFITAPANGKGSFGIYSTYHINRDGSF